MMSINVSFDFKTRWYTSILFMFCYFKKSRLNLSV